MFCLFCLPCIINGLVLELKCGIVDLHLRGDMLVSSLLLAADTVLLADNAKDMKRSLHHASCERRRSLRVQVDID